VVLGAESDAHTSAGIEICQVCHVIHLEKGNRHALSKASFTDATAVEPDFMPSGLDSAKFCGMARVPDIRRLFMQDVVVFVGKVGQRIPDGEPGQRDGVERMCQGAVLEPELA
jgi:hypothetical protein